MAHRVIAVVGWILSIGVVAFGVAFFSAMAVSDVPGWMCGAVVVMVAFGYIVGVRTQPRFIVGTGITVMVVGVVVLAWTTATESVIKGGIPPGPDETMHTPIGWFTPLFWHWFAPSMVWIVACLIPYAGGAALGRLISRRKKISKS